MSDVAADPHHLPKSMVGDGALRATCYIERPDGTNLIANVEFHDSLWHSEDALVHRIFEALRAQAAAKVPLAQDSMLGT